jgi:hypothetical protein
MKINIDIDCSPEEARRFFGMPDVGKINDAVVETVQSRMTEALETMDGETLLREWMNNGTQAWQSMQSAFWEQMRKATGVGSGGGSTGSGT